MVVLEAVPAQPVPQPVPAPARSGRKKTWTWEGGQLGHFEFVHESDLAVAVRFKCGDIQAPLPEHLRAVPWTDCAPHFGSQ